jgi:hypothetical protein
MLLANRDHEPRDPIRPQADSQVIALRRIV